jgi:glycosyltransferase involved in cell wall biosynthesis
MKINYKLTVVGLEGSRYNYQEGRISYYPQEFKKNKIIEYYDKSNIFILPSYTESAPKVIWESLARLRPVIVFDEISHVAKNKIGVYICKRNLVSLTKTIKFIMSNYELIQTNIKKNKFPLKEQFQQQLINILK